MQNLVKIGRSAVELLRILDFQNGGRPPSWIWYDVIADHPRLVFDGPNILLKLHVIVFIHCNISRFLYLAGMALFTSLLGILLPNEFKYCRYPEMDRPWVKPYGLLDQPTKQICSLK